MIRVCFLFNHYFTHQVPHAVPYAFELSRKYSGFECIIACSTPEELSFTREIATFYPGHRCRFRLLAVPWYYRIIDPVVSKRAFLRKRVVLRHNLDFFRKMHALVAPERNCLQLRTRFGLRDLIMIHARHGAGDRQGGFDRKSGAFDLTLLPGQKYVDRLKSLGLLEEGKYAVVGWPKFEVVQGLRKKRKPPEFFQNDNPVIVYNPHFDQKVASWNRMGFKVMEFFKQHPEYNLIFAPHVVLFRRRKRHRAKVPEQYFGIPNIHIDLGSRASTDMTYLFAADIYMGDVSSQVYEFLIKPRPCIFLNAHNVDWKDNPYYFHWRLGQVVNRTKELKSAVDKAFELQPRFEPIQKKAFDYTFYNEPGTTAAERGARAIAKFLMKRLGSA